MFFLQSTEDGFRVYDTGLAAIQIVLLAFHAHGFLSAISLSEEFSAISADEIRHRRTGMVAFLGSKT